MGFSGWPLEAVEFFRGLQADNAKTARNVYKALHEASVREPMAEFAHRAGEPLGMAGYGAAQWSRWTTSSNGRRSGVLMGASGRPAG